MLSLLEIDKLILKFKCKFKGFRLDKTLEKNVEGNFSDLVRKWCIRYETISTSQKNINKTHHN